MYTVFLSGVCFFFFSSRRRHTRFDCDWSSDVCSSDLLKERVMSVDEVHQRAEAVRRFNRFYTKKIGVLRQGLLGSPFSLTEARVIYELAHCDQTTATALGRELDLDAGYLSRILRNFLKQGLIRKQPSKTDGRQSLLGLTAEGQAAFASLNSRSQVEVTDMLNGLSLSDQYRLVKAMETIEGLLGDRPEPPVPYLLRPHQPGDMGWVVSSHGR